MDGHDFGPIDRKCEDCNPAVTPSQIGTYLAKFWQAEGDQSCEEENGAITPNVIDSKCVMFTDYYKYIETPFMVVVPYEDSDNQVVPQIINRENMKSAGAPMHTFL